MIFYTLFEPTILIVLKSGAVSGICSGGCEKKIAHAKLAQGGAKLANGGGADKHSSIDIILL